MPIYKGDTPIVEASGRKGKDGKDGINGENGATYTPSISEEGILSWTNDKNLPNPEPINIKGQDGVSYTLTKSEDGTKIILTGSDGSVQEIVDSNIIYSEATQTESGLMSKEDKIKLDGMSGGGEIQMTTTVLCNSSASESAISFSENADNYDFVYGTVSLLSSKTGGAIVWIPKSSSSIDVTYIGDPDSVNDQKVTYVINKTSIKAYQLGHTSRLKSFKAIIYGVKFSIS